MPEIFTGWRVTTLFTLVLSLALSASALAQNSNQSMPAANTVKPAKENEQEKPAENQAPKPTAGAQNAKGKWPKGKFTLKVGSEAVRGIDLKANEALVAEIAAKLSKEFDIPVLLSPVMQKARVSIEFEGMPLEGAVRLISPQPYADYEISGDGSTMPKIVALYLHAINEPPPSESAVVRGDS
ncbi:MAG TPA: hypothetical protein VFR80_16315, partial [Pyrinomonadaceae bacterium]|nr:hypothetical protein [Pyrinomonadaceae bacterium]